MKKEVNTAQEESNTSQTNVLEIHKDKSITNERIGKTPFRLVGDINTGYKIVWNRYIISETYKTEEEAIKTIDQNIDWDTIIILMLAVIDAEKSHPIEFGK